MTRRRHRPAPPRRPGTAPGTAENPGPGPGPVRHVGGPYAALLARPVTRYSSNTPTPDAAPAAGTVPEEDPR